MFFIIPANSDGLIGVSWTPVVSGGYCIDFDYAAHDVPGFISRTWDRSGRSRINIHAAPGSLGSEGEKGPGMQGTGAVFMLLVNKGDEADRLVAGETNVAEVVEIHETVLSGDVMKMQMLADGLEIPAKSDVLLKPGSYHVMLVGMKQDLKVGDTFTLDLEFDKSGTITVEPEVREP